MFVCCDCCVLSGRGLCDEPIARPEESYQLWCVVVCDLETSRMRCSWSALVRRATGIKKVYLSKRRMGGACRTYGGEESCIRGFGNWMEREHLEDPGVDGRIILRWGMGAWTSSIWLRLGTAGGHL